MDVDADAHIDVGVDVGVRPACRRLEKRIYIPLPDEAARAALLQRCLAGALKRATRGPSGSSCTHAR